MTMRNFIDAIARYIVENDRDHADALEQTGFWGRRGAGCIIIAKDTGRVLIAHRSNMVEEPDTWGTWGGAVDGTKSFEDAVHQEVAEECGYHGDLQLIPVYRFIHESGFVYQNFLAVVENEFVPRLNWETQDYIWCEFGAWPQPLHPGLQKVLSDSQSMKILQNLILTFVDKSEKNT